MMVRDAFFKEIYGMIKKGEDIVVVSSDLGAPSLDDLRKDFPQRFINVGISEQNLLAVAAGLAYAGKHVIAWALNPFPITRAFDQIRDLMGEKEIPITLAALNSGSCSAEAGYTHMAIEDVGMVRMIPSINIINPTDEIISIKAAREVLSCGKPQYIRFDKHVRDIIYEDEVVDFEKGFVSLSNGPIVVVTNGYFTRRIIPLIKQLKDKGIDFELIDLFKIPFDIASFCKEIEDKRTIISLEDNVLSAGIGSLILEIMSDNGISIPVKRYGLSIDDELKKKLINRDYWHKSIGLDDEGLVDKLVETYNSYGKKKTDV